MMSVLRESMMNAIGMIETKGLLAAIEGADVMLKAADVTLLDKSSATGGLITITVTGEVSAVQAAIEAATVSINRLNSNLLISKHVIARPSSSLEKVMSIISSTTQNESAKDVEKEHLAVEEAPIVVEVAPAEVASVIEDVPVPKSVEDMVSHYSATKLQKMNLNNLREIASEIPELDTKIDIKKATKKTLIKIIRDSQINKGRK
jgi:ethanolamine utilization protein EutM